MKLTLLVFVVVYLLFFLFYCSVTTNPIKGYKQLNCNHDFKYKQNVWGYDGDVLMHQYECTKFGRKDYLVARDDPDKDWNRGVGDGKLCDIDRQEYCPN